LAAAGIHARVDGAGSDVLLLLGLGGRLEFAAPIARGLRAAHRVLAFDYPGIGRSTAAPPRDLDGYAALLPALLDEFGFGPAHVVAISFGVPVALTFASRHAQRVRSLTLISGAARADSRLRRISRVMEDAATHLPPDAFARLATVMLFPASFESGREALIDAVERGLAPEAHDLPVVASQARLAAAADLTPLLAGIAHPAKILVGDQDLFLPVSLAQELAAVLPDASIEVFAGAGHSILAERPREAFAAITTFLATIDAR
jgi:pimeloyl-ACP methyl ester carboxylesterase